MPAAEGCPPGTPSVPPALAFTEFSSWEALRILTGCLLLCDHAILCCVQGNCDVVAALLANLPRGEPRDPKYHVDPNSQEARTGTTPLGLAVEMHRVDMVEALVAAPGVNVGMPCNNAGRTPLKWVEERLAMPQEMLLPEDRTKLAAIHKLISGEIKTTNV